MTRGREVFARKTRSLMATEVACQARRLSHVVLMIGLILGVSSIASAAGAWQVETVAPGGSPSMAYDDQGMPCIAYSHDGQLMFARWNGVSWDLETVDTSIDGYGKSLAFDPVTGEPAVSYMSTGYNWKGRKLYLATRSGSTWSTEDVDKGISYHETSLGYDPAHVATIAFAEPDSGLVLVRYLGGGWEREVVGDPWETAYWLSLAFASDGNPAIAYSPGPGDQEELRFAKWNGASWDFDAVDSDTYVREPSLAYDPHSGFPAIAYRAGYPASATDVRYASWNGIGWSVETIDPGRRGVEISLDIRSDGTPYVSYYTPGDPEQMNVAWHDGEAWVIEVVDEMADVGFNSSVRIDPGGVPTVAYGDADLGVLKFARRMPGCDTGADCDPGELCCDGFCTVPACLASVDCDDADICTDDSCLDPGTCSATCENVFDPGNDPSCDECVPTASKEKGPRCSNGLDDDCDGMIDGEDPDC